MDVRTLPDILRYAREVHRKPDAFLVKREGRWTPVSIQTFGARVDALAAELRGRGVRRGDRIVVLSENRIEWAIVDFAVLSLGAITVPFYSTLPAGELAPLVADCTPCGAFVSTRLQKEKLKAAGRAAASLRWTWCFDEEPLPEGAGGGHAHGGGHGAATEAAPGVAAAPGASQGVAAAPGASPDSDDVATIIYTSGTTGSMKGAMLTHRNIVSNVTSALGVLQIGPIDTHLSFLPLSHIFERTAGHFVMVYAGATIAYAETVLAVPQNLIEVRPNVLLAVPRFYEKILQLAMEAVEQAGGLKRQVFKWAHRVALDWARRDVVREPIPASLAFQHALARVLVYHQLTTRLGGRLRLRVAGGAALSRDVGLFFHGIGQTIHEGYGLTETSPVIAVNSFAHWRLGTVGRPLPGVDVRIAEDGEVLVRGALVMKGYWNRPEETALALEGGWFHTGDIGDIDADGYLRITDRKKDVIVTSGGKKIVPQPIELSLKESPQVAEAIIVGDGRKFASVLIAPKEGATREDIAREVDRVNAGLAQFEKLKKFALIPNDLSIENGHLTPTLKVKRRKVAERYRDLIEDLYREA
jgi:long-chain acyl-CoA synthetase